MFVQLTKLIQCNQFHDLSYINLSGFTVWGTREQGRMCVTVVEFVDVFLKYGFLSDVWNSVLILKGQSQFPPLGPTPSQVPLTGQWSLRTEPQSVVVEIFTEEMGHEYITP